jgi:hypothetical protein
LRGAARQFFIATEEKPSRRSSPAPELGDLGLAALVTVAVLAALLSSFRGALRIVREIAGTPTLAALLRGTARLATLSLLALAVLTALFARL